MNKLIHIILLLVMTFCFQQLYSQTEAIPYQTVLYNADGSILKNIDIEVTIDIIQGTEEGQIVFSESHQIKSENNGNIYLEIGTGTPTLNIFQDINWEEPNFISISYKPDGFGMVFTNATIELFSVPYALFSLKVTCLEGCPGPQGKTFDCWDTNFNQINDPNEDFNQDGIFDLFDCPGPQGPQGPDGPDGVQGPQGEQGTPGVNGVMYGAQPIENPMEGSYYVDDGTNRDDGKPGFRYFNGMEWIDL